jgi:hypothetical protein
MFFSTLISHWLLIMLLLRLFYPGLSVQTRAWFSGELSQLQSLQLEPQLKQTLIPQVSADTQGATPASPDEIEKQELLFSDDFSQDLSQWQLERGAWSDWSLVDGCLQGRVDQDYYISELVPADEHWQSHWSNYLLEFDFKLMAGADSNWSWGVEDIDNWYEVHVNHVQLHLTRLREGLQVLNFFEDQTLEQGRVYHVQLYFNQGHIQVWVDGNLWLDRHDHRYEHNGGKISLKASAGAIYPTQVRFDNVQVFAVAPERDELLTTTVFKQHDDRWADDVYDSGQDWSDNPTIQRWGCAMSSLAMILNYHDLTQLPDGTTLNPASLNQWLKDQSDGYIRGGVNWLAGSRLSQLISDQYSQQGRLYPKLEMHRSNVVTQEQLMNIIDDNRPAIIQIPGHFLVANGYTQAQDDLLIADPAYTYDHFSQHGQPLLSAVDYQPSYTDLSYLLLVYDDSQHNLQVQVVDEGGQPLPGQFMTQDTILAAEFNGDNPAPSGAPPGNGADGASENSSQLSPAAVFHYVPKPEAGQYWIEIERQETAASSDETADETGTDTGQLAANLEQLEVYSYDQQARLQQNRRFEPLVWSDSNQVYQGQFQLEFDKEQVAQTQIGGASEPDFAQFWQLLQQGRQQGEISHSRAWFELKFIIQAAEAAFLTSSTSSEQVAGQEPVKRDRYRQLLLAALSRHQAFLSQELRLQLMVSLD